MKPCERKIYTALLQQAANRLRLSGNITYKKSSFDDFVIVCGDAGKYMLKLCPGFWERDEISLTHRESMALRDCDGVVFILGKAEPTKIGPYFPYEYHLVSSGFIREEIRHHLRSVISSCFAYKYRFYNSRIFAYSEQL